VRKENYAMSTSGRDSRWQARWFQRARLALAYTVCCSRMYELYRRFGSQKCPKPVYQERRHGSWSSSGSLAPVPEEERVAYTTVQTLVYRLEQKGALRRVKRIGNAQLFEAAIDQKQFRNRLVRDLLDLFGGSPRLLVSNLLETGTLTLKDLKVLQTELPRRRVRNRGRDGSA